MANPRFIWHQERKFLSERRHLTQQAEPIYDRTLHARMCSREPTHTANCM